MNSYDGRDSISQLLIHLIPLSPYSGPVHRGSYMCTSFLLCTIHSYTGSQSVMLGETMVKLNVNPNVRNLSDVSDANGC